MARFYRVVIASTAGALEVAAGDFTILGNTVKQFAELDSNDDGSFGDIGALTVPAQGWVALAYKES